MKKTGYRIEALVALLVLAAGLFYFGRGTPVAVFDSEVVRLRMDAKRLDVDVSFVYENPYPVAIRQGFSCPTPDGDGLGEAMGMQVSVVCDGKMSLVPLRNFNGVPHGEVTLPPRGRVTVRLRYTQAVTSGRGVYLLTTTQPWGRPLRHGRYELRLAGVALKHSSYELQKESAGCYAFERSEFMPQREWVIDTEQKGEGEACVARR